MFYTCEIRISFLRENKLTLFPAVRYGQIIESIVNTQHFSDLIISLLSDRAFSSSETDRLYEVCKRSSGMDLIPVLE